MVYFATCRWRPAAPGSHRCSGLVRGAGATVQTMQRDTTVCRDVWSLGRHNVLLAGYHEGGGQVRKSLPSPTDLPTPTACWQLEDSERSRGLRQGFATLRGQVRIKSAVVLVGSRHTAGAAASEDEEASIGGAGHSGHVTATPKMPLGPAEWQQQYCRSDTPWPHMTGQSTGDTALMERFQRQRCVVYATTAA